MIEVRNLGKRFGSKWAVHHLNLKLKEGEIYGLLGPNGAGKTTTLRMIANLLDPTEGEIEVGGLKAQEAPLEVKRKIGFLTGNTALYDRLTPREMLRFFGQLHGMKRDLLEERIEHLKGELDLGDFLDRQSATLSTGQRQRVNIARALIHQPEILILDEPTSGLDIISADFILGTIRENAEKGRTILFSTHILAEIELLCDRIGILHRGHLIEEGTLSEILEKTKKESLANAFLSLIEEAEEAQETGKEKESER